MFVDATPEKTEIVERFAYKQEISRNDWVENAEERPSGRIEFALAYDGNRCFPRSSADALADIRASSGANDTVDALIGHLVLTDDSGSILPDGLEFAQSHHGAIPVCVPVQSPRLSGPNALTDGHHEYRWSADYRPARPPLAPLRFVVEVEDPDTVRPGEVLDELTDEVLYERVAPMMGYAAFRPALTLVIAVDLTVALPRDRRIDVVPMIRRVGVVLPRITSLELNALGVTVEGEAWKFQYDPSSRCVEWFDIPMKKASVQDTTSARSRLPTVQRSYDSPLMEFAVGQPGELFLDPDVTVVAEVELPRFLLSGMDARLFDVRGHRRRGQPVTRTIVTTECRVNLKDAFAKRKVAPHQTLFFGEIVPNAARVADVEAVVQSLGFDITLSRRLPPRSGEALLWLVGAERSDHADGQDAAELLVVVQGRSTHPERKEQKGSGNEYTDRIESGSLTLHVRGYTGNRAAWMVAQINTFHLGLKSRFESLKVQQ